MNEAESKSTTGTGFAVVVLDMFHYQDPEEEQTISGFPTLEIAREYARRRTRDSVEEQRTESTSPADLRDRWFSFGEDCKVLGDTYCGSYQLDYFIAHPATAEQRDWVALTPDPRLRELLQTVRRSKNRNG